MSHIIILGSSRSFGNTKKAVDIIIGDNNIPVIDLRTLNITPYDYEYNNSSDDFMPTMRYVMNFDTIIFATPVYWYTMSATMKIFVDRIADLLTPRTDLAQKLRGKKLFVIASFANAYTEGFEDIFLNTAKYLEIDYLGTSFIYSGTANQELLNNNISQIKKAREALGIVI